VSDLIRIEREMQCSAWGKGGRAYIINEAHGLRKPVIRQMLTLLERLPAHVVVVFTTTCEGQDSLFEDFDDANPFLSRCTRLDLSRQARNKPFAKRLVAGARAEGLLNGKRDAYYLARAELLLNKEHQNLRAAWQRVESGYLTDADE
jgi:hypothetical protein